MALTDRCCTIVPYFQVHPGKLDAFKALCRRMVENTAEEPNCLYYGFTFDGDLAHCREGYADAKAALHHVDRVGPLLQEALALSDLARLEVHGPEDELALLRGPLAAWSPRFFMLESGFRR